MNPDLLWLVIAGVGAGLCGSIAGLASLASYPALLAVGLSPLESNVTNTVALVGLTVGSGFGSRRELRGQGRRLVGLVIPAIIGGLLGAALLLLAPADTFELVVPWLVALGAVLILARDRIRRWVTRHASDDQALAPHLRHPALWLAVLVVVGIYGGYLRCGRRHHRPRRPGRRLPRTALGGQRAQERDDRDRVGRGCRGLCLRRAGRLAGGAGPGPRRRARRLRRPGRRTCPAGGAAALRGCGWRALPAFSLL